MNLIKNCSIGKNYPNIINAIIEIPKDSNKKYEYDPEMNLLKLDRCLISSMRYPASYGFIPQTIADDNDPLDVLVYNTVPLDCLTYVEVRPIGALHMIDDGIVDYKIMGIPLYNPNNYQEITDLDETFLEICIDFFTHYKNIDKKKKPVTVTGWENKQTALDIIQKTHNRYKENY